MKNGSAFLNDNAQRVVDGMIRDAERLRIAVSPGASGETLIDAGAKVTGGIEAGLRMAEVAMGGLGSVSLAMDRASQKWPLAVEVRSSQPVLACLGSQYAGWNLSSERIFRHGLGTGAGAGPRSSRCLRTLDYRGTGRGGGACSRNRRTAAAAGRGQGRPGDRAAGRPAHLPLRADAEPGRQRCRSSRACWRSRCTRPRPRISAGRHRRRHRRGADAAAASRFPHRHGPHQRRHHLWRASSSCSSRGPAADARELAEKLPSHASRDYGQPFAEIFQRFKRRFLRHRSAAVQPGRSDRHGDRKRRYISRRSA